MTLDEVKDLIIFGKSLGLQRLVANGVEVVYGFDTDASTPTQEQSKPPELIKGIPAELAHLSAVGRAAMGKR